MCLFLRRKHQTAVIFTKIALEGSEYKIEGKLTKIW